MGKIRSPKINLSELFFMKLPKAQLEKRLKIPEVLMTI